MRTQKISEKQKAGARLSATLLPTRFHLLHGSYPEATEIDPRPDFGRTLTLSASNPSAPKDQPEHPGPASPKP